MARGSEAKEKIKNKILETFEGSFVYDKEIRIPIMEDGSEIQVKVTLTAAKNNVAPDGEEPAAPASTISNSAFDSNTMNAPTPEEKKNVEELLKTLGLT